MHRLQLLASTPSLLAKLASSKPVLDVDEVIYLRASSGLPTRAAYSVIEVDEVTDGGKPTIGDMVGSGLRRGFSETKFQNGSIREAVAKFRVWFRSAFILLTEVSTYTLTHPP